MVSSSFKQFQQKYKTSGIILKLIYINVAVFLCYHLLSSVLFLSGSNFDISSLLALPSGISQLIIKPWTIISYMFFHQEIIHIIFNMLVLFWFGQIALIFISKKQFVGLYILGGIFGGLLYILAYNTIPALNYISDNRGASAAIMAIVFSSAFIQPNFSVHLMFIGKVQLKWIALFYAAFDIIFMADGNAGGHIAHLGGAITGILFVYLLKKNIDITKLFGFHTSIKISEKKKDIKIAHKKGDIDFIYNQEKAKTSKDIDNVLDKISKTGYDSLSKDEKAILFSISKKDKKN